MNSYRFSILMSRDGQDWVAACSEFPGCEARGSSYEEALANIREVIRVWIEDGFGDDEPVPQSVETCFAAVALMV